MPEVQPLPCPERGEGAGRRDPRRARRHADPPGQLGNPGNGGALEGEKLALIDELGGLAGSLTFCSSTRRRASPAMSSTST
ncbi:MAG: hypothetical protein MZV70_75140 [Desulfobacterales bacterium]|nr:hypothetical protein [Desulfobacterales bacterium]